MLQVYDPTEGFCSASCRFLLLAFLLWQSALPGVRAQEMAEPSLDDLENSVAELFERSCARSGCHAGPVPQQNMHLGRDRFAASVVGVPSRERPELMRVHPGKPDSSYLMMKVRGDAGIVGVQMPMIGDRLSEAEINTIAAWIERLEDEEGERQVAEAQPEVFPFTGWKAVNLPTARTLDAGSWLFLISHRFNPKVSDGYETFFGLDGSGIIYLSLGYALTDRFLAALARSNASDNVELQLRYRLARQRAAGGWPVGVGLQTSVDWATEPPLDGDRSRSEAFKLSGQISLTHGFGDYGGMAVVPGFLVNPAENEEGEDVLLTVGLAGRWRFWQNLALVAEWVPILSGYTRTTTFGNDIRFDTWGGGLEITTGGHVFQIVLSNSVGLTTDHYLRGGDLDIREGEARLGFNIFRILNF